MRQYFIIMLGFAAACSKSDFQAGDKNQTGGENGSPSADQISRDSSATGGFVSIETVLERFENYAPAAPRPDFEETIALGLLNNDDMAAGNAPVLKFAASGLRLVPLEDTDLRRKDSPIKNQGQRGTCTAFAMVAGMENLAGRSDQPLDLSEEHLWSLYNAPSMKVLEAAKEDFVIEENLWPYDGRKQAGKGLAYKVTDVIRLSDSDEIALSLMRGTPVFFVTMVNDSFARTTNGVIKAGGKQIQGIHSSHAFLVVGMTHDERAPGGGYLIFKNSWGTSWGDAGYGYLPFDYCAEFSCRGYSLVGTELKRDHDPKAKVKLTIPKDIAMPEELIGTWEARDGSQTLAIAKMTIRERFSTDWDIEYPPRTKELLQSEVNDMPGAAMGVSMQPTTTEALVKFTNDEDVNSSRDVWLMKTGKLKVKWQGKILELSKK